MGFQSHFRIIAGAGLMPMAGLACANAEWGARPDPRDRTWRLRGKGQLDCALGKGVSAE